MRLVRVLSLIVLAALVAGCSGSNSQHRFEFTRVCMGVQCRVVTYGTDEMMAHHGAALAFAEIARLEAKMSDYRLQSELTLLGAVAGGEPVGVSPELFEALSVAAQVSEVTDGAFDVTVWPMVVLWRESRKTMKLPSEEKLREVRELVGWKMVRLDAAQRRVTLEKSGMRLDMGGIAKGYAAERAVTVLNAIGLPRSMVAIGGDIAVWDAPPSAAGWKIGSGKDVLTLSRCCVSTSGDREQFVKIDGVTYSHIVDPRTGLGVRNRREVTVVAKSGAIADAVATALCVTEKMVEFPEGFGIERVVVREN